MSFYDPAYNPAIPVEFSSRLMILGDVSAEKHSLLRSNFGRSKEFTFTHACEKKHYNFFVYDNTHVTGGVVSAENLASVDIFLLLFDAAEMTSFEQILTKWYPQVLRQGSSTAVVHLIGHVGYLRKSSVVTEAVIQASTLADMKYVSYQTSNEIVYSEAVRALIEARTNPLNRLLKKSDVLGSWPARYFSVRGDILEYSVSSSDKTVKGSFPLLGCVVEPLNPLIQSGVSHDVFKVTFTNRATVTLASPSKQLAARWMNTFRVCSRPVEALPKAVDLHAVSPSTNTEFTVQEEMEKKKKKREKDLAVVREMYADLAAVNEQHGLKAEPFNENITDEQIEAIKEEMIKNIEQVLERGEKIELLVDRDEKLRMQAAKFKQSSDALKRRMRWRRMFDFSSYGTKQEPSAASAKESTKPSAKAAKMETKSDSVVKPTALSGTASKAETKVDKDANESGNKQQRAQGIAMLKEMHQDMAALQSKWEGRLPPPFDKPFVLDINDNTTNEELEAKIVVMTKRIDEILNISEDLVDKEVENLAQSKSLEQRKTPGLWGQMFGSSGKTRSDPPPPSAAESKKAPDVTSKSVVDNKMEVQKSYKLREETDSVSKSSDSFSVGPGKTKEGISVTSTAASNIDVNGENVQELLLHLQECTPLLTTNQKVLTSLSQASPQTWAYLIRQGDSSVIASQQYDYITRNAKLLEYYTTLLKSLSGVILAAQAISSGYVKNSKKTVAEHITNVTNNIAHCTNVPGLSIVTSMCNYITKLSNDPERHRQVNRVCDRFPSIESHKFVEILCRELTILVQDTVMLDAKDARCNSIKSQAKEALKWLKYGEVSSPIELYATSHAGNLLKNLLREDTPKTITGIVDLNPLVVWALGTSTYNGQPVNQLLIMIRSGTYCGKASDTVSAPTGSSMKSASSPTTVVSLSSSPVASTPVVQASSTKIPQSSANAVSADQVKSLEDKLTEKDREIEEMKKRMEAIENNKSNSDKDREILELKKRLEAVEKNVSTVSMVIGNGEQVQGLNMQSVSDRIDHHMKASATAESNIRDLALEVQLLKESATVNTVEGGDSTAVGSKKDSCVVQ